MDTTKYSSVISTELYYIQTTSNLSSETLTQYLADKKNKKYSRN